MSLPDASSRGNEARRPRAGGGAPSPHQPGARGGVARARRQDDARQRGRLVALAALVALVDEGALTVRVTRRIPLAELPELHADAAAGRVDGKVIVLA